MQAIRGHHGDFQAGNGRVLAANYNETEAKSGLFLAFYSPLREQLAQLLADTVQLPPLTLPQFADASAAGMKLSGLIVLSSWITSNAETYHYLASA